MIRFTLQTEFIELYKLLKVTGVAGSGGEAKQAIAEGLVQVDGKTETRKACKIRGGQNVKLGEEQIEVISPAGPPHPETQKRFPEC